MDGGGKETRSPGWQQEQDYGGCQTGQSAKGVVGRRLGASGVSTVDQIPLAQQQKLLDAGIGRRSGISACGENAHDGAVADQIPV
jgi:hypothetical protein